MARDAYIIGAHSTPFGKWAEKSFKDLTRLAYLGALADAGLDDGADIDSVWFANSAMGAWGQPSVRGQVCLAPLVREGSLAPHAPVINVENACASGSAAVYGAWKDVLSGQSRLSLAIAAEKLHFTGFAKEAVLEGMAAGVDNLDPDDWWSGYRELARQTGGCFDPGPGRSVFIDAAAVRAKWHMARYGTTCHQLAAACSRCHWYGARNPKARGVRRGAVADSMTEEICTKLTGLSEGHLPQPRYTFL